MTFLSQCWWLTYDDISSPDEIHGGIEVLDLDGPGAGHSVRAAGHILNDDGEQAVLGAGGDVGTRAHEGVMVVIKGHVVGVTRDPTHGCNGRKGDLGLFS